MKSEKYKIVIFKTNRTPGYPQVLRTVRSSLKKLNLNLEIEEVDVSENPEMAVREGVISTPTIDIVGINWRFIGLPTEEELIVVLEALKEGESLGEREK
ncbi:MAG: hypothetical protein ACTSWP_07185 [Candidatus Freyarchaeota archaeon]|nr:thioredoxin family protein [Candidatus Freyrarchaeum guaymaensis]